MVKRAVGGGGGVIATSPLVAVHGFAEAALTGGLHVDAAKPENRFRQPYDRSATRKIGGRILW